MALWTPWPGIFFALGDGNAWGTMPVEFYEEGTVFTLPDCGFTLNGGTFMAWDVAMDGQDEEILTPGREITVTGNTIVTAIWMHTASFTLPAGTTAIEESAFAGDTAITLVDAKNCAHIGANAFEDCLNLSEIRLPGNCTIDGSAFIGCGTVYVFAPAGGTTQTFCGTRPYLIFVAVTE